ncbi:rab5 GDP/GTP exchange factor-like [Halichondria panicea]|uniref:rab5 GDP/GTP exchange factor-like n=1 Tax=Halichondria panicea TaxID=6063 RepID=UPI00312B5B56
MDRPSEDKLSRRLTNPELRCKNKCGFYGNPIYMGYCSKCHKELVRDGVKGRGTVASPPEKPQGSTNERKSGPTLGNFLRFATKKKVQTTAKKTGHGRFFGSPLRPSSSGQWSGVAESIREPPPGKKGKKPASSSRVLEPFNEFLKTLKKPAAQDIVDHLKSFHKHISDRATATVEEKSEAVQEFYMDMAERLQTHTLFRNMTEEQQGEMLDGIEKHLMTNIYHDVYSPASCDDEMKDLLFQRRIRMLNWLETKHLDIPLKLDHPGVQELITKGQQELWAMDDKKAPQDKLNCISKCCMTLLSALRLSQEGPASADEFLPSLIFMIIYTSPQHFHSNINYITRFSNPVRIMSGETGYFFTNLCGAVSFIENVRAENLCTVKDGVTVCMTEEEYNTKMGYVDGKSDVDLLLAEGWEEVEEDNEHKQILESCSEGMDELTGRLTELLKELDQLGSQMMEFRNGLKEQVDSILTAPHSPSPPTENLIDFTIKHT